MIMYETKIKRYNKEKIFKIATKQKCNVIKLKDSSTAVRKQV